MPYIKQQRRAKMANNLCPDNAGELNYIITELCLLYLYSRPKMTNYEALNDIVGALECAKLEFYARKVRPYEDIKIKENGDIY